VLLVAEVVFRSTHAFGARLSWFEPDPAIGYRFTPGREYWDNMENDHPITGRINSLGWRDRERSLDKPPGAYRVAFLGDSFVEAFQVEADSTFLALAEDALTSRFGTPVEILNFGRSGFTQTEEFLVLQSDVMRFSPDLVAVLFNPMNDITDVARETTAPTRPFYVLSPEGGLVLDTSFNEGRGFRIRSAINGLKQRSALVSLIAERWNRYRLARELAAYEEGKEELPGYLTLCTARPDPVYSRNYRLNKILIREMAGYCAEHGARFLLVCGDTVYMPEDIRRRAAVDSTFDPDFFEKDLAQYADSLGVEYMSLQTPFREHASAGGSSLHWGHYNYAGHRVVARKLREKLDAIVSGPGPGDAVGGAGGWRPSGSNARGDRAGGSRL
jgi:hypothetical protein